MNEHLTTRAQTIVACIGIRQRAKGVGHFMREYRRDRDQHHLSAACHHARQLRERCDLALRDATLRQAGVTNEGRGDDSRRVG